MSVEGRDVVKRECVFIDVFTEIAYQGNQLAVFPDGAGLTTEQMQNLAKEINYSETTFVLAPKQPNADFRIRIFTPGRELPFAGHPTLGSAYAITELFDIWPEQKDVIRLETKVGIIPLKKERGTIWMTQNQPEFFEQHTDKETIATLIDVDPEDIMVEPPVEEVSTGNRVLIVPIKKLGAIQKAEGNATNMKKFFGPDLVGPYLFCLETTEPDIQVHTRFFAPHLGILEDPATGSAAGPLVGYLLKHGLFGDRFDILAEQGVEMGRRSLIMMRGALEGGKYSIQIGGRCAYVGSGEFKIV